MKGSEILASLPAEHGRAREAQVLNAVLAGYYLPIVWCPVQTACRGHVGTFLVSSDSLRLGEPGDWTRMMASATLGQEIADALLALLPTDRIVDIVHEQADVRLTPHTQPITLSLAGLRAHHAAIERDRAGREGLTSTVGKDWIIDEGLRTHPLGHAGAVNYGWHGGPYIGRGGHRVWQQRGFRHDRFHADYSQLVPRLVHPQMTVDGLPANVVDVLASAELAPLLSYSGALTSTRYHDVPLLESQAAEPEPHEATADTDRAPE